MSHGGDTRSDFITALLAHDISNYNQTSRGYQEMLLDEQMGPLTDEQARVLVICLRQANRIQRLIEAVRLIDELADVPPQLEALDLDAVIETAIQQVQTSFADREIRVQFVPAGRRVLTEVHLTEIFVQLLSNAVRHNEAEVVEVTIDATRVETPTASWTIHVKDNGEGVPPARQQDLFLRLEQRSIQGSGLGLPLVRFLVERSGGRVWLEPRGDPPAGASFGLSLPAA